MRKKKCRMFNGFNEAGGIPTLTSKKMICEWIGLDIFQCFLYVFFFSACYFHFRAIAHF
jgi:hypothetical protein